MAQIQINLDAFKGKEFTAFDPNITWVCQGFAANDTFLVIGTNFDSTNNRTYVKTFKLSDVKFHGEIK